MIELIDFARAVREKLQDLGLAFDEETSITELTGGVSATTVEISHSGQAVVVKTALEKLKVATDWTADPGRILKEAEALIVAGDIIPGAVPGVLFVDAASHTMIMERIDPRFSNWKTQLLSGQPFSAELPARLGRILGTIHSRTKNGSGLTSTFEETEVFDRLRIEPFYESAAVSLPAVASQIRNLGWQLLSKQTGLVHGDFSPKNILVHDADAVVLDWEVAHFGNTVFDLAFMLSHLVAKGIHLPNSSTEIASAAMAFLKAYFEITDDADGKAPTGTGSTSGFDEVELLEHTACILLGRLLGRSPLSYLTPNDRDILQSLALGILAHRIQTHEQLWETISERQFDHL